MSEHEEFNKDLGETPENGCVFCAILNHQEPGIILEKGPRVSILLSLEGTPLVISNQHVNLPEIDQATAADIGTALIRYVALVKEKLNPDGVNIYGTNGKAAGQEIDHAHIHVIPRQFGDSLGRFPQNSFSKNLEERERIAEALRRPNVRRSLIRPELGF